MSYKTFNNSPFQILHHHSLLSLVHKDNPGYWWITLRQMPYKLTLPFHLFHSLLSVYLQVPKHWAQNGKRKALILTVPQRKQWTWAQGGSWEVPLVNYALGTAFYVELRLTLHFPSVLLCCACFRIKKQWVTHYLWKQKEGFSQHFDISFVSHTYETLMMPAFSGHWFSWFWNKLTI